MQILVSTSGIYFRKSMTNLLQTIVNHYLTISDDNWAEDFDEVHDGDVYFKRAWQGVAGKALSPPKQFSTNFQTLK